MANRPYERNGHLDVFRITLFRFSSRSFFKMFTQNIRFSICYFLLGVGIFLFPTQNCLAQKVSKIEPASFNIHWLAKKTGGQHEGTIRLKEATITHKDRQITGGDFTIDMSSIKCTDIADKEENKKLIANMTSGDFFEIKKYPTSVFKIVKVTANTITGNLTLHGVSKEITFNYKTENVKEENRIIARMEIDRKLFGLKFSGNFFKSLGDKMVHDLFTLDIKLAFPSE
jgi:polyisoprenoid-binding protein YceI